MRDFQRELNTAFDRSVAPWSERAPNGGTYVPSLDVSESETEVTVRADLPGLEKDDINVSLVGNTLTIKGERKDESEEKKEGYYRRERTYGSFERVVELPENVDAGKPKASFKSGVLEIRLAKKESAKPKQIEIDVK
jgi:HSP20 family protein